MLATHAELADLVRLGAYQRGSDPAADEALALAPRIDALLQQHRTEPLEHDSIASAFAALATILASPHAG